MNRKALLGIYDRFDVSERFGLLLEALGRDDHHEMDRLTATCAKKTYTMADGAYTDLVDSSYRVASVFAVLWLHASRDLTAAEVIQAACEMAARMYDRGLESGFRASEQIPNERHPVWQQKNHALSDYDVLRREAADSAHQARSILRSLHVAFHQFCETVDIEPSELLAWYQPLLADYEHRRLQLGDETPLDVTLQEAAYKKFCFLWPTHHPYLD
jgi:hypothetical protein